MRSNQPTKIVLDFVDSILISFPGRPFIVVADSYYSSLELAKKLTDRKLPCLLSCRSDRPSYLFSDYLHKKLVKGDVHYIYNSQYSAISYYDKAKVNILTNYFRADQLVYNSSQSKQLPLGIYRYREFLGPVDHFDRQLHLYYPRTRNIKWTQALLRGLLKIAVNNTYIIAKEMNLCTSLKETELDIIDHLSGTHTMRQDSNRPTYQQRTTGFGHFPVKNPKAAPCAECKKGNKKSNTVYLCAICKVHLHAECFAGYHS